jgi:hypothetical protein
MTFVLQRAVLRTSETRLRELWALLYRAAARVFVICLLWRERRATAYIQPEEDDFLPGLSDVDLVVVLKEGTPADTALRVRKRAGHMRGRDLLRQFPIIDDLRVYEDAELRDLVGSSALTYRLDDHDGSDSRLPAYVGDAANADPVRLLTRPGLYATVSSWRRLAGPERRPPEPTRDAQTRRIDGWLELIFWWRLLPRACTDSAGPRPADVCVKSIADAVRTWAWLAGGERIQGRGEALKRGLDLLPEEEGGLRRMIELQRSLPKWPDSPGVLQETMPMLIRLSNRVAGLIDTAAEEAGFTQVRLLGDDPFEPVLAGGGWKPNPSLAGGQAPDVLPLVDWRGLVCPLGPDDVFVPLTADAGDSSTYLAAAALNDGPYPTLLAERLLIRPGLRFVRTRMRVLECRTTDPVSFALLGRKRAASFPNLRGWSATDVGQRALTEHEAWLHSRSSSAAGANAGQQLGMLLSAARAAVFFESVVYGSPELPLTLTEGIRVLAARSSSARVIGEEALGHYRAFADSRAQPPPDLLPAMRKLVLELPAYARR